MKSYELAYIYILYIVNNIKNSSSVRRHRRRTRRSVDWCGVPTLFFLISFLSAPADDRPRLRYTYRDIVCRYILYNMDNIK